MRYPLLISYFPMKYSAPLGALSCLLGFILTSILFVSCMDTTNKSPMIRSITPEDFVPYEEGFDKGTSGGYGGHIGSYLVFGGGCNFPDKPTAEGGKKKYYDAIYLLRDGKVELLSRMPSPRGYGASVTSSDGEKLYFVGGTDDLRLYPAVFEVRLHDDVPVMERMEHGLPFGWAEGGVALSGETLYLVGGKKDGGELLSDVVSVDLLSGKSEVVTSLPGGKGRIQPVVFFCDDKLYLFGGFCPSDGSKPGETHKQSYALDLKTKEWHEVMSPTLPVPGESNQVALLPFVGTAVTTAPLTGEVFAIGGVNIDRFDEALAREFRAGQATEAEKAHYAQLRVDYLTHDVSWYRFSPHLLTFDAKEEEWQIVMTSEAFATAGALLTADGRGHLYVVGGEKKPGIRTKEITEVTLP